jgi:hypothetical protein
MDTSLSPRDFLSPFIVIIATALIVQLVGRYYASRYLVLGNYFYLLWVLLRIVVPVVVLSVLRVPVSGLGLGVPKINRRFRNALLIMAFVLIAGGVVVYWSSNYFGLYSTSFAKGGHTGPERFVSFMIFTSSTLTGWEFLHRSFLLMGLRYLLSVKKGFALQEASLIALSVCWVFEVVFHFTKPLLEPVSLIIGSPLLSYIALRTGSIWIPFFAHLLVETFFILAVIIR